VARATRVGLSLMPEEDFRAASQPLFEQGLVDALEWNVDSGWGREGVPAWAHELLDAYSSDDRLYAHGVEFSLLSAELHPRQVWWLEQLEAERAQRRFVHLSEHFGFMTAGDFVRGTPLPHPRTAAAVRLGAERLARIADIVKAPVGLENLALAFGLRDVEEQPAFVEDILAPVGGFVLLDLHNLYCQSVNFGVNVDDLLARYPAGRVRELHVAGGSWVRPSADPERRAFRRDSHDDRLPEDLFPLLSRALGVLPNVEVVILERTDHSLFGAEEIRQFQDDFRRVRAIVEASNSEGSKDGSAPAGGPS